MKVIISTKSWRIPRRIVRFQATGYRANHHEQTHQMNSNSNKKLAVVGIYLSGFGLICFLNIKCELRGIKNEARSSLQAVIGAGAAGLVAARELLREGHSVCVLEQSKRVGGVWAYTDEVEDDILGARQDRTRVHSSMYANLRTNLPREVMAYSDFPFDTSFPGSEDPRRFCSHEEVQAYLEAFATHFNLLPNIKFGAAVRRVQPVAGKDASTWSRWEVETVNTLPTSSVGSCNLFDAVVVCNGHYSEPRIPNIPGNDMFPGLEMHSHNYRRPEDFIGQRVVVVGAAFSGTDIAQELVEGGAAGVWLSAREWGDSVEDLSEPLGPHRVGNIERLLADGSVQFEGGLTVPMVDVVLYATGYVYSFPFLDGIPEAPQVFDNRVAPLYKHVFPLAWAPTLSFVGLPWKVVPFPQFELQSRWIARCLSGKVSLPTEYAMEEDVHAFYAALEREGLPMRYTHRMQGDIQREYNAWLEAACGDEIGSTWAEWRQAMYSATGVARRSFGVTFRDKPLPGVDEGLQLAALDAAV